MGHIVFLFMFFKKYLDILKSDIISFVREFIHSPCIPDGCDYSFITLIPKEKDLIYVHDFIPSLLLGFGTKSFPSCWKIGWRGSLIVLFVWNSRLVVHEVIG